jgi:hypothetical protein
MSKPPLRPKPPVRAPAACAAIGTRHLLARFLPSRGWPRKGEAAMKPNAVVLAAVIAIAGAGAARAHNDFTDRAEYYAATPQSRADYEPEFYYYPGYVEPLYRGRSIYLAPRRGRHFR